MSCPTQTVVSLTYSVLLSLSCQELDLSNNQMGPQAFRAVLLGLCHNSTIHTLKMANNQTDTDSAVCHYVTLPVSYSHITHETKLAICFIKKSFIFMC